ncbi:hypothetical protein D5F01_LYC07622 [Larimichthys crocea]|uniref:Uncharacterized protein n=1 Tax=Larimichthys crocea TaxID=215358 RepID=A0A6G0ITQ6_LARCR|nr:hypothetical protein D5F01_LYC07622 [Larimichthys crocea]
MKRQNHREHEQKKHLNPTEKEEKEEEEEEEPSFGAPLVPVLVVQTPGTATSEALGTVSRSPGWRLMSSPRSLLYSKSARYWKLSDAMATGVHRLSLTTSVTRRILNFRQTACPAPLAPAPVCAPVRPSAVCRKLTAHTAARSFPPTKLLRAQTIRCDHHPNPAERAQTSVDEHPVTGLKKTGGWRGWVQPDSQSLLGAVLSGGADVSKPLLPPSSTPPPLPPSTVCKLCQAAAAETGRGRGTTHKVSRPPGISFSVTPEDRAVFSSLLLHRSVCRLFGKGRVTGRSVGLSQRREDRNGMLAASSQSVLQLSVVPRWMLTDPYASVQSEACRTAASL